MLITKRYASYTLVSPLNLDSRQLQHLTTIFNTPAAINDSGLGGRTSISLTSLEGIGPVVIKHYARGGLVRHVMKSHYLKIGKSRSQREYEFLQRMSRIGLNVPEPILFAHKGTLFYKAWLVTRRINHARSLANLSIEDEKHASALMLGIADQVSILIENNILHIDFHPGNVLVDDHDRVFIVDFDRASVFRGSRNRLRDRYLNRWRRAVIKHELPNSLQEVMENKLKKETSLSPPSILIVLMGSLGDVVRGFAVATHIKHQSPDTKITWLVEPKCADLVAFHPHIDNMIVFDRPRAVRGLRNLYRELDRQDFDITLDLQRHFKSGFFSLLSGANRRIGFHRLNAKEFNWIFNSEHIPYFDEELPKLYHYLKFAQYLGYPDPASIDFGLSSLDPASVAPRVLAGLNENFIAIVLGSAWESKDWFFEGYDQLIEKVTRFSKRQVVLLGDPSQRNLAYRLSENRSPKQVVNLTGQTSLLELAALLKAAAVGLGPDSGPGHLAAAMGTPFVSLFGPTSPARTAPYGSEHLVVQAKVHCAPCYKRRCPGQDRLCMRLISAQTVWDKLSQTVTPNQL